MDNTAILILAAGNSTRFGDIKQLLPFNGKTLLQHVIDEATGAGPDAVVVVVGANANTVSASIDNTYVEIVFNNHWQDGMASGIAAGVRRLSLLHDDLNNIIIGVCDQPFITSALFKQLHKTQSETQNGIVGCSYAGTIGTPVLFTKKYFDQLLSLQGDEGAKKILKLHSLDVGTVNFPNGNIDIDTESDYREVLMNIRKL
jgi:molybdenum cofactor cytidylyltransferase